MTQSPLHSELSHLRADLTPIGEPDDCGAAAAWYADHPITVTQALRWLPTMMLQCPPLPLAAAAALSTGELLNLIARTLADQSYNAQHYLDGRKAITWAGGFNWPHTARPSPPPPSAAPSTAALATMILREGSAISGFTISHSSGRHDPHPSDAQCHEAVSRVTLPDITHRLTRPDCLGQSYATMVATNEMPLDVAVASIWGDIIAEALDVAGTLTIQPLFGTKTEERNP